MSRTHKLFVSIAAALLASTIGAQPQSSPISPAPEPISKLPSATTPLSGSELVPLVQSGVTKQTTATNFLAGGLGYTPARAGVNSDITSLLGLTSPLSTATGSVMGTPYAATGANSSATQADASTFKGVSFDARSNFGFACNGSTDDTAKMTAMVAAINAMSAASVRVFFPGTCMIGPSNFVITKSTDFEGVSGGGLKMLPSSTMSGIWFNWIGGAYTVTIKNMVFDYNSATIGGNGNVTTFGNGLNVVVDNNTYKNINQTVTAGQHYFAINFLNVTGEMKSNSISFLSASSIQNQCVNGNGPSNFLFEGNVETDCGNLFINVVDNVLILGNVIKGWGYGAGIGLNTSATDTALRNIVVADNVISSSLTTHDQDTYYMAGIDSNFYGTIVHGNRISNTCGAGMYIWGRSTVTGNLIVNPGTCNNSIITASAISVTTGNVVTNSGSGSFVNDNTGYGTGALSYGLTDNGQSVVIGSNDFTGFTNGSYSLTGQSTFTDPQTGGVLINPCGMINQTNGTGSVSSNAAYGPDGWKVQTSLGGLTYATVELAVPAAPPCPSSILATVTSTRVPGSTEFQALTQIVPLGSVRRLGYGTAKAQTMIQRICVKPSIPGPFTFATWTQNLFVAETFVHLNTFVGAANTVQCFSYPIPGDPTNTLGTNDAAGALKFGIDMGAGSSQLTSTADQWVAGTKYGLTGASSFISNPNGTTMAITGMGLSIGSLDRGWEPLGAQDELFQDQKFYWTSFPVGTAPAQGVATGAFCAPNTVIEFARSMNTAPVVTTFNPVNANANWYDSTAAADVVATVGTPTTYGVPLNAAAAVAGHVTCIGVVANARL